VQLVFAPIHLAAPAIFRPPLSPATLVIYPARSPNVTSKPRGWAWCCVRLSRAGQVSALPDLAGWRQLGDTTFVALVADYVIMTAVGQDHQADAGHRRVAARPSRAIPGPAFRLSGSCRSPRSTRTSGNGDPLGTSPRCRFLKVADRFATCCWASRSYRRSSGTRPGGGRRGRHRPATIRALAWPPEAHHARAQSRPARPRDCLRAARSQ
jgi:hypothetical protein